MMCFFSFIQELTSAPSSFPPKYCFTFLTDEDSFRCSIGTITCRCKLHRLRREQRPQGQKILTFLVDRNRVDIHRLDGTGFQDPINVVVNASTLDGLGDP